MDRIYKYNPDATYKPNQGRYLQLISAKDLYIQNVTVSEHDSFQVKFPNIFTNYPLGAMRVEDQRFIDWDRYKFTLWQAQLNFVFFCASFACGVSVEHMNAKKPMIISIYPFHVYYHIRRILKIPEIPLPYENSFNQYNNPYSLFSIYVRSHVTFASAILMEYQICSIHNSQCSFLSVFYCNVVVVSRIIAFNFDYI